MANNGRTRRNAGFPIHYTVPAAAATVASAATVLALTDLPTSGTTTVTSGITNPTTARCLSIVGDDAGITGNVVINGTNVRGAAITETIALNGTTTVAGTKAFATVTSIVLPTRNQAGDQVSVGVTEKLGFPSTLSMNTVFRTFHNKTVEGTAPTVTVDDDEVEKNTFDLNTALNGSQVDILYIV